MSEKKSNPVDVFDEMIPGRDCPMCSSKLYKIMQEGLAPYMLSQGAMLLRMMRRCLSESNPAWTAAKDSDVYLEALDILKKVCNTPRSDPTVREILEDVRPGLPFAELDKRMKNFLSKDAPGETKAAAAFALSRLFHEASGADKQAELEKLAEFWVDAASKSPPGIERYGMFFIQAMLEALLDVKLTENGPVFPEIKGETGPSLKIVPRANSGVPE